MATVAVEWSVMERSDCTGENIDIPVRNPICEINIQIRFF